jgi:hypothetical protein
MPFLARASSFEVGGEQPARPAMKAEAIAILGNGLNNTI